MTSLARYVVLLGIACHSQTPAPIAGTGPSTTSVEPPPQCVETAVHRCGRIVVSSTDIEILDPIQFVGNTAALAPVSTKILDSIAQTIIGNPSILKVEVAAYGGPSVERRYRQALADQRTSAIIDVLIKHGVEPQRLKAHGIAEIPAGAVGVANFEIVWRAP